MANIQYGAGDTILYGADDVLLDPVSTPRTLDARMAERANMDAVDADLAKQEQALVARLSRFRTAEGADEVARQLNEVRAKRARVQEVRDNLGVGQTGRIVGSTLGGTLGAIGGGTLGSGVGPAGTVGGAVAGSLAGTAIGSGIGSWIDTQMATDITDDEAMQLLKNNLVEDVAYDALGNLVFFGGGKVLKVTGASRGLHNLASKLFGASNVAPAAVKVAPAADTYVKPGEGGYSRDFLEWVAGKPARERLASEANQPVTNRLAAGSVGLDPAEDITEAALRGVRKDAGDVYADLRKLGNVRIDQEYTDALDMIRKELSAGAAGFPGAKLNQAALDVVDSANVKAVDANSIVDYVKQLRSHSNKNFKAYSDPEKLALAHTQRDVAEALEKLMERDASKRVNLGIGDASTDAATNLPEARRTISRSYDIERALNDAGELDARILARSKSPLTNGLSQVQDFAARNKQSARPPSALGDTRPGLSIYDIGLALAGGGGGLLSSGDPSVSGIAGAVGFFARPTARLMLKNIYERATKAGNKKAATEAARLIAMSKSGKMTAAMAQVVRNSIESLIQSGYWTADAEPQTDGAIQYGSGDSVLEYGAGDTLVEDSPVPGTDRQSWQIDPAVQRERDMAAFEMVKQELARDPTNPALQREIQNRARALQSQPASTRGKWTAREIR